MKIKVVLGFVLGLCAFNATASLPPGFNQGKDCFSEFNSYDKYTDFLRSKNPDITNSQLENLISREEFESIRDQVSCTATSYKNDDFIIPGVFLTPKNLDSQKAPVLIYNRGGNSSYGAITFFQYLKVLAPFAQQGYIVAASQYRGLVPQNPEIFGKDEFGGKDVSDVHYLIDAVKQHPNADAENIFLYGASRGGMMNYLLARERDDIRAMAVHAAPTDALTALQWRPAMERVYKARIPDYENQKEEALKARSVLYWTEELPADLPILITHGSEDKRVNPQDAIKISNRLKELNRPHKLVMYEGGGHALRQNRQAQFNEVLEWFSTHRKASAVKSAHAD